MERSYFKTCSKLFDWLVGSEFSCTVYILLTQYKTKISNWRMLIFAILISKNQGIHSWIMRLRAAWHYKIV
jgi:hypothetical protein